MKEQTRDLDFAPLVEQLIEKSKAGKLKWAPTANRNAFVVSVGGDISFRIWVHDETDEGPRGEPISVQVPKLALLDEKGQQLWDLDEHDVPSGELKRLYDMARRIGNRLDERVAGVLSALEKL
jgi:hypothetical protein